MVDCVTAIMQGVQPTNAGKPLPAVNPATVAACKADNPTFGQAKNGGKQVAAKDTRASAAPQPPEQPQVPTPLPGGLSKPNVIFVLTDDLAINLLKYMPNVQEMQKRGTSFGRYFVTDSLCCPSRSSIFTGKFPHDTGVFTNSRRTAATRRSISTTTRSKTFAIALQADGYDGDARKVPQRLRAEEERAAGGMERVGRRRQRISRVQLRPQPERVKVVHHGKQEGELPDGRAGGHRSNGSFASRRQGRSSSRSRRSRRMRLIPRRPGMPTSIRGSAVPRTAAYGARPDANAPRWLKDIPPLNAKGTRRSIDEDFRKRVQAVQAVDKMIGELRATRVSLGIADKTYVVFSSDNGYHMGDYSLRPGKRRRSTPTSTFRSLWLGPGVPTGAATQARS